MIPACRRLLHPSRQSHQLHQLHPSLRLGPLVHSRDLVRPVGPWDQLHLSLRRRYPARLERLVCLAFPGDQPDLVSREHLEHRRLLLRPQVLGRPLRQQLLGRPLRQELLERPTCLVLLEHLLSPLPLEFLEGRLLPARLPRPRHLARPVFQESLVDPQRQELLVHQLLLGHQLRQEDPGFQRPQRPQQHLERRLCLSYLSS